MPLEAFSGRALRGCGGGGAGRGRDGGGQPWEDGDPTRQAPVPVSLTRRNYR